MNYLRKLKHRKGFTLVELVVVVGLIAIIVVCVAAFSSPVNAMVAGTKAKSDALTINKIVGDYLERKIGFADRVRIFINCDASVTGASTPQYRLDPNNAAGGNYGSFTSQLTSFVPNDPHTPKRDQGGAIVLRYVADANDPQKSTYKIYDIPADASAWPNAEIGAGGWASYEVFDTAFYGGYEFLISLDADTISAHYNSGASTNGYLYNKNKNKFFLNFDIKSFNFDESYVDNGIKAGTLQLDTRLKVDASSVNVADQTAYNNNEAQRTGVEKISFTLHNVKSDPNSGSAPKPAAATEFFIRGFTTNDFTTGAFTGNDIVIFYHTKSYDVDQIL